MNNFKITNRILSLLPNAQVSHTVVFGGDIAIEIRAKCHHYRVSFPQTGQQDNPIHITLVDTNTMYGKSAVVEYFEESRVFFELFENIDEFEAIAREAIDELTKAKAAANVDELAALTEKQKRKNFKVIKNSDEAEKILNHFKKIATSSPFDYTLEKIVKMNGEYILDRTNCYFYKEKRISLFVAYSAVSQADFKDLLVGNWIRGDIYSKAMEA
ncbi:hypothetical protein [Photobacterium damselae]|uniref:hypothetical protein n=1 Tax=Photobacterium damselae TaxID=38293 RepID=UPI004067E443